MKFLLQQGDYVRSEKRAVKNCGMDFESIPISAIPFLDSSYKELIPVGTVEFCTALLNHFKIAVPRHMSYPTELGHAREIWKRDISVKTYQYVEDGKFVKPWANVKQFTGHIKGEPAENLENIDPNTVVYYCDKVNFVAEWRYYVLHDNIVGYSRYDDSEEEFKDFEHSGFSMASNIKFWLSNKPDGYSIDIGLLDTGEIACVELNDGWALGYYKFGTMTELNYLRLIEARWKQLNV